MHPLNQLESWVRKVSMNFGLKCKTIPSMKSIRKCLQNTDHLCWSECVHYVYLHVIYGPLFWFTYEIRIIWRTWNNRSSTSTYSWWFTPWLLNVHQVIIYFCSLKNTWKPISLTFFSSWLNIVWKFRMLSTIVTEWLLQSIAHESTAVLPWNVQKFLAHTRLQVRSE